jgi:hypothetical protein
MASFFKGMIVKRQNALLLVGFTMEAFHLAHNFDRFDWSWCGDLASFCTEPRLDRLPMAKRNHRSWKGEIGAEKYGLGF